MPDPTPRRTEYVRPRAHLLVRPAGLFPRVLLRREAALLVRCYSDDPQRVGALVELEFLLEEGPAAVVIASVDFVEELGAEAPARYDVGMRIVRVSPEDLARIGRVLEPVARA